MPQPTPQFTFSAETFDSWTVPFADAYDDDELADWDPTEFGSEDDIYNLVQQAQTDGVIAAPPGALIMYSYSHDGDGGGYIWLLDLRREPVEPYRVADRLRLGSGWEEQRKIVTPYETVGRDAMRQILQEAVYVANTLLVDLERWTQPAPEPKE